MKSLSILSCITWYEEVNNANTYFNVSLEWAVKENKADVDICLGLSSQCKFVYNHAVAVHVVIDVLVEQLSMHRIRRVDF